jgi:hypothetical protein
MTTLLAGNPNNPTLGQLIAALEKEREKHGDDVRVGIHGGELVLYRSVDQVLDLDATPRIDPKTE